MNLSKFFRAIGLILSGIIVIGGLANGWIVFASNQLQQRSDFEALAQGTAAAIHRRIRDLEDAVSALAVQEQVVFLLAQGDVLLLAGEAERLGRQVPGVLRLRLLKTSIQEPDKTMQPQMGYADLRMAREALEKNPQPMVHEFTTQNNHLAIARRVLAGDRVVGVVLASISTDVLSRSIAAFSHSGAIELKQGPLRLGVSGDNPPDSEPEGSVPVSGTSWTLNYWLPGQSGFGIFAALLVNLATLTVTCALIFIANRRFSVAFTEDMNGIIEFTKSLLEGRIKGNYPFRIHEFEVVIKTLTQPKWKKVMLEKVPQSEAGGFDILDEDLTIPELSFPAPKSNRAGEITAGIEVQSQPRLFPAIFRAYDIRGIVDRTLDEAVVILIGQAFGSEARDSGQETVAIARDGRLSSPRLSQALARGLEESGCHVIDLGMVPTPVLYFATHFLETRSGVMVTGSHNPPDYNGLKMVIDGETLAGQRIQELRHRIESADFRSGNGSLESRDLIPDYVGTIIDDVQIGSPLKIVVDCGNGVAGKLAPILLRTLGCDVVELYCEVDGSFPNHHPDPGKPENLQDLIARVQSENADLGIAFDGDGDRLGVIDSSGKIIWPDRLMMLFAADVLSRQPGADIIFDVKCSRNLSREIVRKGGRPLMWKTGHSLIKAKMKQTQAALAGEMSGHIFFKERWFGFDDGLYAAARLIEIVSADFRSSSEIFQDLPDSINTPELNVLLEEGENFKFVEKLLEANPFAGAKITDLDGLRADYPEGWGLVRASNTTPSLVLRFEANDHQSLKAIQEQFRNALTRVKPDIQLPF